MDRLKLFAIILMSLFSVQTIEANTAEESTTETVYRPFIEDDKEWMILSANFGRHWYTKTYYFGGDTIVGNQPCKKLMLRYENYMNETVTTSLHCCMFEEDARVYYYPADDVLPASPIMLYDFSAKPGDAIVLGGQREDIHDTVCYQVWQDGLLEKEGETFRWQLATEYNPDITYANEDSDLLLYKWYEGIGSRFNPFVKKYWNKRMGGAQEWLYECRVAGRTIYFNSFGETWPTNIGGLEKSSLQHNGRYTLDGKQIQSNFIHGIYIEDGKKILVK